MAIAHVQTPANGANNGSATSINISVPNVTAGSCLVCAWRYGANTGRTVTVSDDKGNTWVSNVVEANDTTDASTNGMAYALNVAAGTTVVTFGISGGALNLRMIASEFSGVALAGALDQTATAIGGATNPDAGTVTPTTDGQVLLAAAMMQAGENMTVGTDFTLATASITGSNVERLLLEYFIQATAAGHATNYTNRVFSTSWGAVAMTLKAAGTGSSASASPSPSVSPSSSQSPSRSPSVSPSSSQSPSRSPSVSPSSSQSPSRSPSPSASPSSSSPPSPAPPTGVVVDAYYVDPFPLSAHASQRYLVDRLGRPYLVVGDAPHVVPAQLSLSEMDTYFGAMAAAGFNAAWIDIFGDDYFFNGRGDWGLEDGTDPFTATLGGGQYDFTAPNETFFARIDAMLDKMQALRLCAFLNPYDTAGNLSDFTANGTTRVQALGTYLGARYKDWPNLVWFVGNDFQTWTTQADSDLFKALCDAILAEDTGHLLMTQMEYPESKSWDNATTLPITTLGGVYAYYPIYAYIRAAFEHATTLPCLLQETWYTGHTFQGNGTTLPPSTLVMRKQAYWGLTSGALAGYLAGNDKTDGFNTGWETAFAYTVWVEYGIWKGFINSLGWQALDTPDWAHAVGTAGRGTYAATGSADTNNYVTLIADAASTIATAVAYCPASTTLTVDLSKFRGTVTVRRFDPCLGTYAALGSFANSGTHDFASSGGAHVDGAADYVLRFDA